MPWRPLGTSKFALQILKMSLDYLDACGQGVLGEVASNETGKLNTGLFFYGLGCQAKEFEPYLPIIQVFSW